MKTGLYAGSFDPWSIGHQYVLENALEVFDALHVLLAVHPSKKSWLDADTRARIVAHTNDPTKDWWNESVKEPFLLNNKKLTVSISDGLVAEYAHKHKIHHLVRGMRSTTDFEAEFNLYFANHAIDANLQTWAVMCPPRLLYCSSTYIRAVVGKSHVQNVGTNFAAQAVMLNCPVVLGQVFDLYYFARQMESNVNNFDGILSNLQKEFFKVIQQPYDKSALEKLRAHIFEKNELQDSSFYLSCATGLIKIFTKNRISEDRL